MLDMSDGLLGQIQNKSIPRKPYFRAVLIEESTKDFLREDWLSMEDKTEKLLLSPMMEFAVSFWPFQMERRVVIDGFLRRTMAVKLEKYCSSGEDMESWKVELFTVAKPQIR